MYSCRHVCIFAHRTLWNVMKHMSKGPMKIVSELSDMRMHPGMSCLLSISVMSLDRMGISAAAFLLGGPLRWPIHRSRWISKGSAVQATINSCDSNLWKQRTSNKQTIKELYLYNDHVGQTTHEPDVQPMGIYTSCLGPGPEMHISTVDENKQKTHANLCSASLLELAKPSQVLA